MHRLLKLFESIKSTVKECVSTGYASYFYYHGKIKETWVLFESRNGLDLAGNIFYLLKEIKSGNYPGFKVYLSVCKSAEKKARALISTYNIPDVHFVKQGSYKYFKLLGKVKYIFTDTSLPRAYIKKDGQVFTNTWHGTPLKKMGKYNIAERHSMGNVQRCLLFSDYLIFPNDYMREKMLESYNIDTLYKGTVLCEGYPRNTAFFSPENTDKIKSELGFNGKKLYVYMPTWKAENIGKTLDASLKALNNTLKQIDEKLEDDEIFLLKLHPFVKANAKVSGFKHIKSFPETREGYEVLSACDVLVTDYSSVFFDFGSSRKKIVLFTPDEESYDAQRGFYFPLSDLPFEKTKGVDELVSALRSPKNYDDSEFVSKFCQYDNKDASRKILCKILKGEDTCKVYDIPKSDKKKVLLYCGALLQNGLTAAFKNLLGLIDLDDRDYYFAIKQKAFKNHPERLDILPEKIKLYSIASGITYAPFEGLLLALYYKFNMQCKLIKWAVDRIYNREFNKHFNSFDMDYVINFSGYDKYIIKLLNEFKCKKTIFVHSDMQKEISERNNQHRPTLKEAYNVADKVAVVTDAMKPAVVSISGREDNVVTVNNSFDAKRVRENSLKEIEYQKDTRNSIHHPNGIEGILSSDATKFISVGRYSSEKQHFMLIDAFDEYYKQNKNSYLIIIGGSGNLYAQTVRYANSKESSQNIALLWSVQNPMPILKRCDMFILSSKYEALGLVLLEADALGVPCICTEMDGPKELVNSHGGTMVENSVNGILSGMKLFKEGKVSPMNIDFDEYNKLAISQFEELFC